MPAQIQPDPIGDYFPVAPYALGQEEGLTGVQSGDPLRAIANTYNEFIFCFIAEVVRLRARVSVQTADGPYLDYHGVLYGVPRMLGELDGPYRARILAAQVALTIPALTTLVNAYLNATNTSGASATAIVWDLQSRPDLDATIGYVPDIVTGEPRSPAGLVPGEFVIDVASVIPYYDAFFLDNAALDNSFLTDLAPPIYTAATCPDDGLVKVVTTKKAGCFRPLFRYTLTAT